MFEVTFAGDKIRLYIIDSEKAYKILDEYWDENYKKGQPFPSAGYSVSKDADAFDLTEEQWLHFVSKFWGTSKPKTSKRELTTAQREARKKNAEKARQRRLEVKSV